MFKKRASGHWASKHESVYIHLSSFYNVKYPVEGVPFFHELCPVSYLHRPHTWFFGSGRHSWLVPSWCMEGTPAEGWHDIVCSAGPDLLGTTCPRPIYSYSPCTTRLQVHSLVDFTSTFWMMVLSDSLYSKYWQSNLYWLFIVFLLSFHFEKYPLTKRCY